MAAQLVAGGVAETLAAWCVTWRHLAFLESTVTQVLLEDHEQTQIKLKETVVMWICLMAQQKEEGENVLWVE